jgi:NADH-quinone oxidoreductase subunit E
MSHEPSSCIDEILARHRGAGRDALIPLLQEAQQAEGYLSELTITRVGRELGLAPSKVFGVATFYNQFRFQPRGRYHFMVCRGTACHVKGSAKTLERLTQLLRLKPGQTSRDRLFSLEVVACMGACGLGPVVNLNGEFFAKVTPKKLAALVDSCRHGAIERPACEAPSARTEAPSVATL